MFPSYVAEHTAICQGGKITFPPLFSGATHYKVMNLVRVLLRGGHCYDMAAHAIVPTPHAMLPFNQIAPGCLLPAPCALPRPSSTVVPYSYTTTNNAGRATTCVGSRVVTPDEAELLGWLVGDGSLHAENQSIRFANGDAAVLQRVTMLCKQAFPDVKISWYPKVAGYDLTFTKGINNPLRDFLRQMDFYEGCPLAVGQHFAKPELVAFLRGLWGADGWCYSRKGGNDIMFGLSRTSNQHLLSWIRLLHAGLDIHGAREVAKNGSERIVFNGYPNYAAFMREIGQIGQRVLSAPPVRRAKPSPPHYLANAGESWYDAPVLKIVRLTTPSLVCKIYPCQKTSTKPMTATP